MTETYTPLPPPHTAQIPYQYDVALTILIFYAEQSKEISDLLCAVMGNLSSSNHQSPKAGAKASAGVFKKHQRKLSATNRAFLIQQTEQVGDSKPIVWPLGKSEFKRGMNFWLTGNIGKKGRNGSGNAGKTFTKDERVIAGLVDAGIPPADLPMIIQRMRSAQESNDLHGLDAATAEVLSRFQERGQAEPLQLQVTRLYKAIATLGLKKTGDFLTRDAVRLIER